VDALPFGAVKIDDRGTISVYNRYESELGGIAPSAAIGKNFFTDIAPCTNNKVFRGCFTKAVEQGTADCLFSYTFTYKMRPTEVKVHLHRSGGVNWMLIAKK
jgi:photoactive yellow protein